MDMLTHRMRPSGTVMRTSRLGICAHEGGYANPLSRCVHPMSWYAHPHSGCARPQRCFSTWEDWLPL